MADADTLLDVGHVLPDRHLLRTLQRDHKRGVLLYALLQCGIKRPAFYHIAFTRRLPRLRAELRNIPAYPPRQRFSAARYVPGKGAGVGIGIDIIRSPVNKDGLEIIIFNILYKFIKYQNKSFKNYVPKIIIDSNINLINNKSLIN